MGKVGRVENSAGLLKMDVEMPGDDMENDTDMGEQRGGFSPGDLVRDAYRTVFRYLERINASESNGWHPDGTAASAVIGAYSDFLEDARRILVAAIPYSDGGPSRTGFRKLKSLFMGRRVSVDAVPPDYGLTRPPDKTDIEFVGTLMVSAAEKLGSLADTADRYGFRDDDTVAGCREMADAIMRTAYEYGIGDTVSSEDIPLPSYVIKLDPAYRGLYKSWYRLVCGLEVIRSLQFKEVRRLYGYWCFLEINRMLEQICIPEDQNCLRFRSVGAEFCFGGGKPVYVRYVNRIVDGRLELRYEDASECGSVCRIVLKIKDTFRGADREYVFLPCAMPVKRNGTVAISMGDVPAEEGSSGTSMVFCPGNTGAMRQSLDDAVFHPVVPADRLWFPEPLQAEVPGAFQESRDVLVGTLRNREQLEISLKNRFYHIPAELADIEEMPVSYVALYQSKRLFGTEAGVRYWGRVSRARKLSRSEIGEIPKDSEQLYYRFEIEEWNRLPRAIKAKEISFNRGYTNLFLLLHSRETPELFIASHREYVIYEKLRALSESPVINDTGSVQIIRFGNVAVVAKSGDFLLCTDGIVRKAVRLEDYLRTPMSVVKAITEMDEEPKIQGTTDPDDRNGSVD